MKAKCKTKGFLRLLAATFVLFVYTNLYAQKTIDTQSLVWYGYALDFKLSEQWRITHNAENRQFWFPGRQHQFITINKVHYNFKNGLKLAPGITFFQITTPQDPGAPTSQKTWEIRPHIEAVYTHGISSKFKLQNRALFEWRYFENSSDNFAFTNYRYRHRVQLSYRLNNLLGFRLYDELIVNIGKRIVNNTFDQNRLGLASKLFFKNGFALELGYLNWYQQQASGQDFFNRHIVQFTISKVFDFRNKEQ